MTAFGETLAAKAARPPRREALEAWLQATFVDVARQWRWSFLPPLMVYLAAGVSGLTAIVGTFFVKEQLGLSASFLAGLTFWAGLPWALKMPLGHLVDLLWRWKDLLVYLGAALIAISITIMYGLIAHTPFMTGLMSAEAWFVLSSLLAPIGYVVQDVVADAMTVEAVPAVDERGDPWPEAQVKAMHTTMQTLGRVAIIGGFVLVAGPQHHHVREHRADVGGRQGCRVQQRLPARAGDPRHLRRGRRARRPSASAPGGALTPAWPRRRAYPEPAVRTDRTHQAQLVDPRRQPAVRRLHPRDGSLQYHACPGAHLHRLHGHHRPPHAPAGREPRPCGAACARRHGHHHLRVPGRPFAGPRRDLVRN